MQRQPYPLRGSPSTSCARAHGKDERIGVKDFDDGLAYIYELVRTLARPAP